MSIISCKECGSHVSTKAKECPHCGAVFPKRAVFLLLALVCVVAYGVYYFTKSNKDDNCCDSSSSSSDVNSAGQGVENGVDGVAKCEGSTDVSNVSCRRDEVERLFKSDSEPAAKNALWAGDSTFKVSVVDNGLRRDAYAMYVCNVLHDRGAGGRGVLVQIVDDASAAEGGESVVLGEAHCE